MAVSKRLRYEILRRDNHACRYCGAAAPDVKLNVDHVIPTSLGGSDKPNNLVTSCADCNSGKTSSLPNAEPVADVDQEMFRQIGALARETRDAMPAHLTMVWAWAWEKTGRKPSGLDYYYFAIETAKTIATADSAGVDLTEAAYKAGLDNAIDIQSYLELPDNASAEDKRFVAGVDAINAWDTAWEAASPDGPPVGNTILPVIDQITAALDAGHQRDDIVNAARQAGASLSTDLLCHLPSGGAL
ncbi:HNH endonuclease [Streptomyces griseoaurantiacus]|uniref:HNH endonuclease n=1 Tax=Streptomyces griseoaurantiacus TaxID=68213 RepID=UPI0036E23D46